MTTSTPSPRKSSSSGSSAKTSASRSKRSAKAPAKPKAQASSKSQRRTITITVPPIDRVASGAANAVLLPLAVARQVIPAKGGLPLYVGLGVLGAADILEWPVAIGIGIGYAVLRRSGTLAPAPSPAKSEG
jgi:hypothetical protein